MLLHILDTIGILWETKINAVFGKMVSICLKHFNIKPKSPTANTSSINNISGSIWAATAKPSRTFMPLL